MNRFFLIAILALTGCHTFRTTAVDRCEHDTLVVNPECPLHGIPVTLRVPTHLELQVVETTFWRITQDENSPLEPLISCRPTRTVQHRVIETEKVFLVDPVQPGAGTANSTFTFQGKKDDPNQANAAGKGYLRNVAYKIEDRTIKESADLLASSLGLLNALATSSKVDLDSAKIISTDRTIAYGRFDLNSPTYECDVAAFLECNLNTLPFDCAARPQPCIGCPQ